MCNGPSLNEVDFDMLDESGVFTFGLNKINLLFNRTSLRPSVIVAVNPFVIEQNSEFYNKTDTPLFLDSISRRWVRFRPDEVSFYRSKKHGGLKGFLEERAIHATPKKKSDSQ